MDSSPLSAAEELSLPREWSFLHGAEESCFQVAGLSSIADALHAVDRGLCPPSEETIALSQSDLIELATQTWRLEKRVQSMGADADKRASKQFSDSVRRFSKLLQRFSVEYEDPTHKPYTSGWQEVEVISWEEAETTDPPVTSGAWVKQTISPIIRRHNVMVKAGQVVCVDSPDS